MLPHPRSAGIVSRGGEQQRGTHLYDNTHHPVSKHSSELAAPNSSIWLKVLMGLRQLVDQVMQMFPYLEVKWRCSALLRGLCCHPDGICNQEVLSY